MFGMCFALLYVIKLVTLIEFQEINGFNIGIGPSNPPTKDYQIIKMNVQSKVLQFISLLMEVNFLQCFFSELK